MWGKVIEGMENVDKIKRGEPVQNPDKISSMKVAADVKYRPGSDPAGLIAMARCCCERGAMVSDPKGLTLLSLL